MTSAYTFFLLETPLFDEAGVFLKKNREKSFFDKKNTIFEAVVIKNVFMNCVEKKYFSRLLFIIHYSLLTIH
jgi:hypothetical protein